MGLRKCNDQSQSDKNLEAVGNLGVSAGLRDIPNNAWLHGYIPSYTYIGANIHYSKPTELSLSFLFYIRTGVRGLQKLAH